MAGLAALVTARPPGVGKARRWRTERLAAQDLAPLRGDDAGWPWDIGAVAILDGSGLVNRDGRFEIEAVRRAIEVRLHLLPASAS